MPNMTGNTDVLQRAVVYSDLLMKGLEAHPLPDGLARDVSDFGDGQELKIPTIGGGVLHDVDPEKQDLPVHSLDTGAVYLTINQFKGVGYGITDKLKEETYGNMAMAVESEFVPTALRDIRKAWEVDFLAQVNKQTLGDPNTINEADHRFVASGTNDTITYEDFAYMTYAFDQAYAPQEGRIAIVPPIVGLTLDNGLIHTTSQNNPMWEGIVTTGFTNGRRFIRNINGWDVYVDTKLPKVSETINGGPVDGDQAVTDAYVCNFMCVADDMTKPIMNAWRRNPRVRPDRNEGNETDIFYVTSRWGQGVQRFETLGGILVSSSAYE